MTDTLLKRLNDILNYDVDVKTAIVESKTYSTDLILRKETIKTYLLETLIRQLNATKSADVDVNIVNQKTSNYDLDIYLHNLDMCLYALDVPIKECDKTLGYLIDELQLYPSTYLPYIIDVLLEKSTIKNYSIQTLLKKIDTEKTFSIDDLFVDVELSNYNIDLHIANTRYVQYSLESLFESTFVIQSYIDLLIADEKHERYYNLDTLLVNIYLKNYIVDMNIAERKALLYFIDNILLGEEYFSYFIDVLLGEEIIPTGKSKHKLQYINREYIIQNYSLAILVKWESFLNFVKFILVIQILQSMDIEYLNTLKPTEPYLNLNELFVRSTNVNKFIQYYRLNSILLNKNNINVKKLNFYALKMKTLIDELNKI